MGAADLLQQVRAAGFRLEVADGRLLITPASKLTDELRAELRQAKPELLQLLSLPLATYPRRPYALTVAEADRAHADCRDDAVVAQFVARVSLFIRRGVDASEADDLAERLVLRDREGDDRALCLECSRYRPRNCTAYRAAGLQSHEVGHDLAARLQRCLAFRPIAVTP